MMNRALRGRQVEGYTPEMPRLSRSAIALFGLLAMLGPAGCSRPQAGATSVVVIGDRPRLVDPAVGALAPADALLLGSVAQGLVRFDTRGQIEAGLAERWNVSDDGLNYIFRLQSGTWPSGRRIDAKDVARLLNRERRRTSLNALRDTIGAIDEVVAMTDRVIEIRLRAPRPNLLQLLAQPELTIFRDGEGTGPFALLPGKPEDPLHLSRTTPGRDGDSGVREDILLSGLPVPSAVARFRDGAVTMVLGGTFSDLPVARSANLARGALRFDPVAGLFALVPARSTGPIADPALRSLLTRVIDRDALVASFDVERLTARTTLLQSGLEGVGDPAPPAWTTLAPMQRRAGLAIEANRLFGRSPRPVLTISLPAGPGSTLLFNRLAGDFAVLGIGLKPAAAGEAVDLVLVDEVAPSTSPAWFVRRLRCDRVALCDPEIDSLADAARDTTSPVQRAQFLALAAQRIDQRQLIIPLTAPIRWSLVSPEIPGFAENRFARHTFIGLAIKPNRDRD